MALRGNQPWTETDIERLKSLVASGASAIRCAAAFNKSVSHIREQARKLWLYFPSVRETRKKLLDSASNSGRPY